MKYKARPNTRFSDSDAKVIGSYLETEFPNGVYSVDEVIERAKSKSCPLHKYFTWDVKRAALLHWRDQARKLITCYFVDIRGVSTPSAVSVLWGDDKTRHYMSTKMASQNEDIWATVLAEALQGLISWKWRYSTFKQLKELNPVIDEITKLEKKHGKNKENSKRKSRRDNKNPATSAEIRRN
jgi:hypothetical protein